METQRFGFSSIVALEEDSTGCVIGCVNFQFEWFLRIRVSQDGFRGEDVYDAIKGFSACGGPIEWGVLLEQCCEWLYYVRKTRDKCSVVIQEAQGAANFSHSFKRLWPCFQAIGFGRVGFDSVVV